jgi:ABC-type enterochelin transport system substrate-binding protein
MATNRLGWPQRLFVIDVARAHQARTSAVLRTAITAALSAKEEGRVPRLPPEMWMHLHQFM